MPEGGGLGTCRHIELQFSYRLRRQIQKTNRASRSRRSRMNELGSVPHDVEAAWASARPPLPNGDERVEKQATGTSRRDPPSIQQPISNGLERFKQDTMPHTPSAKRRLRQNKRRRAQNRSVISELRTTVKALLKACKEGKADEAKAQLKFCHQKLDKCGVRRYIHPNTAARTKARLTKRVNAIDKAPSDATAS